MSSPSGTSSTDEKSVLSSFEVCSILEASQKSGVTELKFRGLHVRFGTSAEQLVGVGFPNYPLQQQISPLNPAVNDLTAEQHATQNRETLEIEQMRLREQQLALMMIEDPQEYERLMQSGELTDDVDAADSDDE